MDSIRNFKLFDFGDYKMFVGRPYYNNPKFQREGCWDAYGQDAMKKVVKEGMIAVDVGANVGYFTLPLSLLVGSGQVYAFEPHERFCSMLKRNINMNSMKNVVTFQLALSDKCEKVECCVDANVHYVGYAADTFDSLNLKEVNFVKIDTEGFEVAILKGMRETLRRSKNVHLYVEYDRRFYRKRNVELSNLFSVLDEYGFEIIGMSGKPNAIKTNYLCRKE